MSFCSQGEGGYLTRYPPGPGTPPRPGTTPGTRYNPLRPGTPPRTRYAPQTRYTPWTRYSPDQVHPPGPGTPPRPGTPPWDQGDTVYVQAVCILLECNLVYGNVIHRSQQERIRVGCVPPAFLIRRGLPTETPWTETPSDRDPPTPRRNMEPGSQTGSDII